MSSGVPLKVLHEAEGHVVIFATNTGEVYRGKLIEAEDNMNCQMSQVTVAYRDGRVTQLENVYIQGSKIRFLVLPDMLDMPQCSNDGEINPGPDVGKLPYYELKREAEVELFGEERGIVNAD